eukprot:206138_1
MVMALFLLCLTLFAFTPILSDEASHEYTDGESITVWVNKVGPFNNPTETYAYFKSHVPFCNKAEEMSAKHHEIHYSKFDGLGSLLEGNNLVHSGIPMKFKQNQDKQTDCTMKLDSTKAQALADAIASKYWYQMFIDDLPVWGMVGEYLPLSAETAHHHHDNLQHVEDEQFDYDALTGKHIATYPHVFTHKAFSLSYHEKRVIEINLTSEHPVLIRTGDGNEPQSITMTYSVEWRHDSTIEFRNRFDRYLDFEFFEHQIHWFALWNSFMLVIFLVGMVSMVVLRALKKDYERLQQHSDSHDDYESFTEETGWKKLHGDVFRKPFQLPVFAAIVGTGYQIYTGTLLVILLAIAGRAYDTRGTVVTSCVTTYAVTSLINGYTQSQTFLTYSNNQDPEWKTAMIASGVLFPSVGFLVTFCLNMLSVSYAATNAVSFGTYCVILAIWVFAMILLFIGTLVGRSTFVKSKPPSAVNKNFVHPIPTDRAWYMNPYIFCVLVGVLPFGSIFIEMYYIFNSFWNYKFYYVYGFMLLVFLILTIVTACVTIVSSYILLNAEDRRWKWLSIFSGGSTAIYVFAYSTFYFLTKTQMTGIFQTSFYFGYMFLFSLTIFFMCSTIGYVATSIFVRRIYSGKFD